MLIGETIEAEKIQRRHVHEKLDQTCIKSDVQKQCLNSKVKVRTCVVIDDGLNLDCRVGG